jgi:spore coat protein CotH
MKLRILFFLFTLATYSSAQSNDESWQLYDDSEVGIVEISVDPAKLEWIYNNVQSDSLHFASIHFRNKWIDETIDSVGFRLRGNTSRQSAKKSFKISFNTFIKGRKFYNVEKLNLNGEHNDPSIIRSKICWDLYETIGMPASRAAHTSVYINGDYYGLYISVEQIDDEFLQKNFNDDSDNLWKCLYGADLKYKGPNPQDYYPLNQNPPAYELKTNKEEYEYSKLAELISTINLTPFPYLADSLEKILVIPEFIKYLAMNTLVGSWDDYRSLMNNYYIYHENDIFHWIPYDYDNTFGIDWFDIDWANANPYDFPRAVGGDRPLADRIIANSQYRNLYSHFLEFMNLNVINNSSLDSSIDRIHTMITPFAESDQYRTLDYQFTINQFHRSYTSVGFNEKHVKRGLKEFIKIRSASLPEMISYQDADPLVYNLDYEPKFPTAEDTIYVRVSAFSNVGIDNINILHHPNDLTVVYNYPMTFSPIDGTKKVEEADLWLAKIPPLGNESVGRFQIQVSDVNSNIGVFPRTGFITLKTPAATGSKITINELLANNESSNPDQDGEYDDWVELFNSTSEAINLGGLYLTDDQANLMKWQFPANTTIEPNQYLLVWCDNNKNQEGLHANFQLSVNGEFLGIVDSDGISILDSITFPIQSANVSYGRYPDVGNEFVFMDPTPENKNVNIVNVKKENKISTFELFQNYPNPFNPSTIIKYSIGEKSFVTLKVFDILGQEISTLVNSVQDIGNYQVEFNSSAHSKNLPSGVYFYSIKTKNFSAIKKGLLIK